MAIIQQIYAVVATRGADDIRLEIEKLPEDSFYGITDDAWLVAYEGTTRQLAERLGIRGGATGAGLVLQADAYSVRASDDLWEWLKVRSGENA
jgi:hypothetical protein